MSRALDRLVVRRVADVVIERSREAPVVALQGPRGVGKSTLLRSLGDLWNREVVDLDDVATRNAVAADPVLFVSAERPVLIDEFQHVPILLDVMKGELNRDGSAGQYVMTGSTRYDALPRTAQSLTGRVHLVDVLPLSQGEIDGVAEDFLLQLLADAEGVVDRRAGADRADYVQRIVAGGLPLALWRDSPAARERWFDDYVELVLTRDVLEIARIRRRRQFPLLLGRLAAQSGQVLNLARAAADVEMDRTTAEDYARLLEAVFLIRRLPAWGTTMAARVAASPKVYVIDSGLAARLLRLTAGRLGAANPTTLSQFGHLLETFVVGEVLKQVSWLPEPVHVGHWRTHDNEEVDLVVERSDGTVVGIEVKASSRISGAGKGLNALKRRAGSAFAGGVVLYTGQHAFRIDDRLVAAPVSRLWT